MGATGICGSPGSAARQAARAQLENLEQHTDENDSVPYGATKAKFQTVRLLGVQGYLAAAFKMSAPGWGRIEERVKETM